MSIEAWWKSMSTTEKISAIFRGITTVGTLVGGGICLWETHKSRQMIRVAVRQIGDGVDVEVSDELVNAAVKKAAEDQIRRAVRDAKERTMMDLREDTKVQVAKAVKENYDKITEGVAERIGNECGRIYKDEILSDIKDKAAEKLEEKLDSNLDEITDGFAKNLNNMGKIYEALADKLEKKA